MTPQSPTQDARWVAFSDEILKIAATRQVKEMRKLYEGAQTYEDRLQELEAHRDQVDRRFKGPAGARAGDTPPKVRAIEKKIDKLRAGPRVTNEAAAASEQKLKSLAGKLYGAGVQKDSPGGIQADRRLNMLGRGNEGVAVKVLGPRGVEVRKQYDHQGQLWSPELRRDKVKLLEAAKGNPNIAQLHSAHEHPNFAVHRMEYVKGHDIQKELRRIQDMPRVRGAVREKHVMGELHNALNGLDAAAEKAGLRGHRDALRHGVRSPIIANDGNVKFQPDGTVKVIDVLPTRHPATVRLEPGRLLPMDDHAAHFPQGIRPDGVKTPLTDLTKRLGPGSRQAPRVPGAKVNTGHRILDAAAARDRGAWSGLRKEAPWVAGAAAVGGAGAGARAPTVGRSVLSGLRKEAPWVAGAAAVGGAGAGARAPTVGRSVLSGLQKAAPWVAGAAAVGGAGLLAHHVWRRNHPVAGETPAPTVTPA